MITIYKFAAPTPFSTTYIQIPEGARFIKSAWRDQDGAFMWFIVDTMKMWASRTYTALPTGGTIDEVRHTYVDTYFEYINRNTPGEVQYVWHIFEVDAKDHVNT